MAQSWILLGGPEIWSYVYLILCLVTPGSCLTSIIAALRDLSFVVLAQNMCSFDLVVIITCFLYAGELNHRALQLM